MYFVFYRGHEGTHSFAMNDMRALHSILMVFQKSDMIWKYKIVKENAVVIQDLDKEFGWPKEHFTKYGAADIHWYGACDYMLAYTDEFISVVFDGEPNYIRACAGMVSAHGDKVEQYRDYWEENGLDFNKAQIIYFLTYTKVMDLPKHKSKEWVLENYEKYASILP